MLDTEQSPVQLPPLPSLPDVKPLPGEQATHVHARKHFYRLQGDRVVSAALKEHQDECWIPRLKAMGRKIRKRDREEQSVRWHQWSQKFNWRALAAAYDDERAIEEVEARNRALQDRYDRMAALGELGIDLMEREIRRIFDKGESIPKSELSRLMMTFFKLREDGLRRGKSKEEDQEVWRPDTLHLEKTEFHLQNILSTVVNINGEPVKGHYDAPGTVESIARIIEGIEEIEEIDKLPAEDQSPEESWSPRKQARMLRRAARSNPNS